MCEGREVFGREEVLACCVVCELGGMVRAVGAICRISMSGERWSW
uniref:Uncharacterized protein n=1 Tax=Bartonella schoenbuchensis (strain DSM 13525 / NCTC 13165 / R1) TaxID=687861 RepID=E6Z1G1_BARSR|nr:hypothetical protein BARSC_190222 [Bartonella schoenbuchensis R1]